MTVKPKRGTILNYEISGSGPVIVLLHGYLSGLRYWDTLRPALETNYTVIAIDLLGFGDSPKPKSAQYSYDDHAYYIKQTLAYCNVRTPVLLVGHSMGALIATHYAAKYPASAYQLLLMNTPLFKDAQEAHRELAETNLFFRLSLYWGLHRVMCPLMRTSVMQLIARQAVPKKYRGMETCIFSSSAKARSGSLRNVIEGQHSMSDLGRLKMPVTLIQAHKERPMYIENLLRLPKKPNLRILFAETGHHTLVDEPGLALSAVAAWRA